MSAPDESIAATRPGGAIGAVLTLGLAAAALGFGYLVTAIDLVVNVRPYLYGEVWILDAAIVVWLLAAACGDVGAAHAWAGRRESGPRVRQGLNWTTCSLLLGAAPLVLAWTAKGALTGTMESADKVLFWHGRDWPQLIWTLLLAVVPLALFACSVLVRLLYSKALAAWGAPLETAPPLKRRLAIALILLLALTLRVALEDRSEPAYPSDEAHLADWLDAFQDPRHRARAAKSLVIIGAPAVPQLEAWATEPERSEEAWEQARGYRSRLGYLRERPRERFSRLRLRKRRRPTPRWLVVDVPGSRRESARQTLYRIAQQVPEGLAATTRLAESGDEEALLSLEYCGDAGLAALKQLAELQTDAGALARELLLARGGDNPAAANSVEVQIRAAIRDGRGEEIGLDDYAAKGADERTLIALMTNDDSTVRKWALGQVDPFSWALMEAGGKRKAEALAALAGPIERAMADDDAGVRVAAVDAALDIQDTDEGRFAPPHVVRLLRESPHPDVRTEFLKLADVFLDEAYPEGYDGVLERSLASTVASERRAAAGEVLRCWASVAAGPRAALQALADAGDLELRCAARMAAALGDGPPPVEETGLLKDVLTAEYVQSVFDVEAQEPGYVAQALTGVLEEADGTGVLIAPVMRCWFEDDGRRPLAVRTVPHLPLPAFGALVQELGRLDGTAREEAAAALGRLAAAHPDSATTLDRILSRAPTEFAEAINAARKR